MYAASMGLTFTKVTSSIVVTPLYLRRKLNMQTVVKTIR